MSSHRNAHHGTSFARRTRQTALPYTSLGCISTLVTCDTALCICSRLRGFNGTTSARSVATRTLTIRGYVERKKGALLSSITKVRTERLEKVITMVFCRLSPSLALDGLKWHWYVCNFYVFSVLISMYLNIAPYSLLFSRYIDDEWFYYIYFILFLFSLYTVAGKREFKIHIILAYDNYTTLIVTLQY